MLDLYLLRHGKAGKANDGETDYDRQLNKKGVAQIEGVGKHLSEEGQKINQLISSSATRTKETSQIILKHIEIEKSSFHDDLYLASNNAIIKLIHKEAKEKTVIYVGHNFGISDLATELSNQQIAMSTGMIVHLTFDCDDWININKESVTNTTFFTPIVSL
jgi:phosphohistidine phosphatase